ncbi:MAG: hypothetical protein WD847_18575 [Pirellulales bacterium]
MIPCTLKDEPEDFDARCRRRGRAWIAEHPGFNRPRDFWSQFEPHIRAAFGGLCAYCAMLIMRGQIDHFRPIALLRSNDEASLAYEWSNLRYGEAVLNGKKWKHVVLDPFDVQEGWFEILLPSLQLHATDMVPVALRELAAFTITKLGLRDGEVVIRYRREWFKMYQNRELSLSGLRNVAPQIADAVESDLRNGKDWRVTEGGG